MGSQDVYDRSALGAWPIPKRNVWFGGPSLVLAQAARDSLLDCRARVGRSIGRAGAHRRLLLLRGVRDAGGFPVAEKVVKRRKRRRIGTSCSDPKWKKKLIIRDPLASGTMRAVVRLHHPARDETIG